MIQVFLWTCVAVGTLQRAGGGGGGRGRRLPLAGWYYNHASVTPHHLAACWCSAGLRGNMLKGAGLSVALHLICVCQVNVLHVSNCFSTNQTLYWRQSDSLEDDETINCEQTDTTSFASAMAFAVRLTSPPKWTGSGRQEYWDWRGKGGGPSCRPMGAWGGWGAGWGVGGRSTMILLQDGSRGVPTVMGLGVGSAHSDGVGGRECPQWWGWG